MKKRLRLPRLPSRHPTISSVKLFADEEAIETIEVVDSRTVGDMPVKLFADEEAIETRNALTRLSSTIAFCETVR